MHHHTHRQASKVQVASRAVLESSDSLCGIFDMWQSKCRPGLLPSRADLTHEDLQPWFGYIILLNVVDRGEDFRYRLFGSRIAEELGFDMSGKLVSEHPNRDFMPHYLDAHRMAVEQRVAMVTPAWPELDTVVLRRRLIMPLAADGRTVNIVMTASYPIDRDFETTEEDKVLTTADRMARDLSYLNVITPPAIHV